MPVKRESGSRKRQAAEAIATATTKAKTKKKKTEPGTESALPAGVTAVRLLWTDFAGLRRCRVIPSSLWASVASGTSSIRISRACAALQSTMDAPTPGASEAGVVGDVSLCPVTRPARLPWHREHAVSLCELRKLPEPEEEVTVSARARAAAAAEAEAEPAADAAAAGELSPENAAAAAAASTAASAAAAASAAERSALTPECFSLCPRGAARRAVLVAARSKPSMTIRFGFETEFKLAKRRDAEAAAARERERGGSGSGSFADPGSYCHSLTLDAHAAVLDEIVASVDQLLDNAGLRDVRVEQWHVEAGDSAGAGSACFELVTSHAGLVEAVDALVLTREAICQIARRRGFDAVFLPKPDGISAAGIGCHAHFSVYDAGPGENLTRNVAQKWSERNAAAGSGAAAARQSEVREGVATAGEAFVAGVCHRLDALLAFTASGPTSHLRLQRGCWAGAPSSSPSSRWGPADKEAPLRTLADNVELKPMDATANPYHAAAALVAAGLEGVAERRGLVPPRGYVSSTTTGGGDEDSQAAAATTAEAACEKAEAACKKALEALRVWSTASQPLAGGGLQPIFAPEALDTLEALRAADLKATRDWSYEKMRGRLSLLY